MLPCNYDEGGNGSETEAEGGENFEVSLAETRTAGYRFASPVGKMNITAICGSWLAVETALPHDRFNGCYRPGLFSVINVMVF
jgi:hypothetical protein